MKYIKQLDFLSNEAHFTFNEQGDTINKTFFGGIITILSFSLIIVAGIYFFVKLVSHDSILIISSTESSYFINLTQTYEVPILFRLSDKDGIPYNDSDKLYSLMAKYWYGGTNSTNRTIENTQQYFDMITVEKCDINKHFGPYQYLFESMNDLNTFYCPSLKQPNQTVHGIYGSIYPFGFYDLYFKKCYKSLNESCYEDDVIIDKLYNTYLDFRTIDYEINPKRLDVESLIVRSERITVSLSVFKRIWMSLDQVKYITDIGLFFDDYKEKSFFKINSMRNDYDLRDYNSAKTSFLTFSVVGSGQILYYKRQYQKIQDYIATLSGIIKLISLLSVCLNYSYSRNTYYYKLINGLFFSEYEYNLKTQNLKKSKLFKIYDQINFDLNHKLENKNDSSLRMELKTSSFSKGNLPIKINQNNNTVEKIKVWKKQKISSLGYFLPFKIYTYTKKDKFKLLYYYEEINKRLNIVQVLQNLSQYEKFLKFYYGTINNKKMEKIDNLVLANNKNNDSYKNISSTIIINNVKKNNIIQCNDSRNS